jgi:hypothetical protein
MVRKTDYAAEAYSLTAEQLKRQFGDDSAAQVVPSGGRVETVFFPAFSFQSDVVPFAILSSAGLTVEWASGQENKGTLIYGAEYQISGNRIVLTDGTSGTIDWTPTVQANALGLLNITVTKTN